MQWLFEVTSKVNNEFERAYPVFLATTNVLESRDRRRQALHDAGALIVLVLAIERRVIHRSFNVDVNEVPSIGALPFRREFVIIGPIGYRGQ